MKGHEVPQEESLFGDMGVPQIVNNPNPRSRHNDLVQEAWSLWVTTTNRPPSSEAPDKFASTYRELLKLKFSHERLMRCVRAAAHLPPRPRDPRDIKRVLAVLDNYNVESEALSLLDQGDSPIYLWEWDENERLCSVKDIAYHCNTETEYWSPREQESAGVLITSLTIDRLEMAANRVKLHLGQQSIFPSEVVRNSFVWRNPDYTVTVKATSGRDTYHSGQKESDTLDDLDLDLDEKAENFLLKGCPASIIRRYHLQAPEGYWNTVLDVFESDDDVTLKDIYRDLQADYDWHPADRAAPEW